MYIQFRLFSVSYQGFTVQVVRICRTYPNKGAERTKGEKNSLSLAGLYLATIRFIFLLIYLLLYSTSTEGL